MGRVILHSDLNNFFASVECARDTSLKDKPVVVCGDEEKRCGVVVAKNYEAKKFGIATGDTVWQAKRKCPEVVCVPPHFAEYHAASQAVRAIYCEYTDLVEPFGLDEAWLDVSGSLRMFGGGRTIANALRERVKSETGLTVSIGVSFNKVFAKLGSDMKKPDAVTVISPSNFKELVWPLAASELLYVGRATAKKLAGYGIVTIGELARADRAFLKAVFGKHGDMLWEYANGRDSSSVAPFGVQNDVKSISNTTTFPRDTADKEEIRRVLHMLADSVCARLRAGGFSCTTVALSVRGTDLKWRERQRKLQGDTVLAECVADEAFALFLEGGYTMCHGIGIRLTGLAARAENAQLTLFENAEDTKKKETIEKAVDSIRARFGHPAISRALQIGNDEELKRHIYDDNNTFPDGKHE
ncbi:MAG: DNA polymerase IV [Clostridia bacterium]